MKQPRKQNECVPFLLYMNENEKYMKEALKWAQKALDINEVPVGAVIVFHDEIIGWGYNSRQSTMDITGHAEIMAIRQASQNLQSWKLNDCIMYVTLEPCIMCAGAIQQARIEKLYYGADDKKTGAFGSKTDLTAIQGLNHYPLVFSHILEKECKEIMQCFFQNVRADKQK